MISIKSELGKRLTATKEWKNRKFYKPGYYDASGNWRTGGEVPVPQTQKGLNLFISEMFRVSNIPNTCSMVELGELHSGFEQKQPQLFADVVKEKLSYSDIKKVAIFNTNTKINLKKPVTGLKLIASYNGNCGTVYTYMIKLKQGV